MGKIRVTALGGKEEEKLREKQTVRREEKKKREAAKKVHIAGMKGGERIKEVGAQSEEELEKFAKLARETEEKETGIEEKGEKKVKKKRKARSRSKRYQEAVMKLEHGKIYPISQALLLLRQISLTKFDPSVELHINTSEKGLRGAVQMPHGTGKKIKVVIADSENIEELIKQIEAGKIDFNILVAHPNVMSKLAKVAKTLGPRGLMPNPKAGTISAEPEKAAEKFKKGVITWKTEANFPIIHQTIGKLSFKDKQLQENFRAFVLSIGKEKINNITLKTTMSPGIKVQIISQ